MMHSFQHSISQKVSEIFDLYTDLHDIRISLFSPDGALMYPDEVGRPNCSYCMMLRDDLGLDRRCRELDGKMMQAALEQRSMVAYTCHAGMCEAVSPLIVNEELVGFVMLGQFRNEAEASASPYAEVWGALKGDNALQIAYDQSTIFPEQKVEALLSMFRHLLELIIGSELIHHKDYDLLAPVIEQIHQRPEVALSLEEAAQRVGRSTSAVTRLFKKVTGQSFKQYQLNYRMEQAALQLKGKPNRSIGEIALSVGYDDPLYFSRIFRKHYGQAPSRYRTDRTESGAA